MITTTYIIYLCTVLIVVIFVGKILTINGRFFLVDIFGDEALADITNRALFACYCLINAGGAFYCLTNGGKMTQAQEAIEYVVINQGKLLLLLGAMHMTNLVVLPHTKKLLKTKNAAKRPKENNVQP
jgi:hypothetical protein